MKDWFFLSTLTAMVVFFGNLVSAEATNVRVHSATLTAKSRQNSIKALAAYLQRPDSFCQELTLEIPNSSVPEFDTLVGSLSLEVSDSKYKGWNDLESSTVLYKIRSALWIPNNPEFQDNVEQLRSIPGISFLGCKAYLRGNPL